MDFCLLPLSSLLDGCAGEHHPIPPHPSGLQAPLAHVLPAQSDAVPLSCIPGCAQTLVHAPQELPGERKQACPQVKMGPGRVLRGSWGAVLTMWVEGESLFTEVISHHALSGYLVSFYLFFDSVIEKVTQEHGQLFK